jgi:drug/metabolite transporter (DMT)-like permease
VRPPATGSDRPVAAAGPRRAKPAVLGIATLLLFLVWSHTFLAFEVLLTPKSGPAPLDWLDLVVARFVPVFVVAAVWCFGFRRRESLEILRAHPGRLCLCGLLAVAAYNGFLYYGMEHRVAGPVASLLTTLSPLYLVVLGIVALGEPATRRKVLGLVLGFAGVVLIATTKKPAGGSTALAVAITALAPLSWSFHTTLTKTVTATRSPVLWTFLVLVVGSLPFVVVPFVRGADALLRLSATDVALVLYLSLFATIGGFAVWSWLLRHLPASTVGLTIFLNPPLTTAGKYVLSALLPASFSFEIAPQEWIGGALALAGVAVAVLRRRAAAR